jgi:hypothetical protein
MFGPKKKTQGVLVLKTLSAYFYGGLCQWMAKPDFLENCNPASNPGKAGFSWILSRISG